LKKGLILSQNCFLQAERLEEDENLNILASVEKNYGHAQENVCANDREEDLSAVSDSSPLSIQECRKLYFQRYGTFEECLLAEFFLSCRLQGKIRVKPCPPTQIWPRMSLRELSDQFSPSALCFGAVVSLGGRRI
jgi:hypothetical protein